MNKIRVRKRERLVHLEGDILEKTLTYQLDSGEGLCNSTFVTWNNPEEYDAEFSIIFGNPRTNPHGERCMLYSREALTRIRDMLTRVLNETKVVEKVESPQEVLNDGT